MVFNSSDLSTATYIRDFLKKNKKKLVPTLPNFFQAVPLNTEIFFGLIKRKLLDDLYTMEEIIRANYLNYVGSCLF